MKTYKKINFEELYNNDLKEYKEIREKDSEYKKRYLQEIDLWKNKYMISLISKKPGINKIIEIGCATGDLLQRFPINVKPENRFGIDISKKNILFAKKNYPKINFIHGTIDNLDFPKNYFDLLILSDIIEHVEKPLQFLRKTSQISKYIVINLPLQKCQYYKNRKYGPDDEDGHLRAYNFDEALSLIGRSGLKIIKYKQKYICKEDFFQRRLIRDFFPNMNFSQSIRSLPKFFKLLILNVIFYKVYFASNLFAFLKKEE